jgi:phosphatidate cytidylyltransferase
MNMLADIPREFFWLFGGLAVLLGLATLFGRLRVRGALPPERAASLRNFNDRVDAWWVMVAVLAAALLLGPVVTVTVFGLMSYFALREFVTLTPTTLGDRWPLSLAFFAVLPAQYLLIGYDQYGTFSIFVPVYAFLLLPALAALQAEVDDFLARTAKLQWGLMITVYCVSHAPALLMLDIPGYAGQNALLLFFLLFVVQISDVMQYVFGKLFGRTKVAPIVSPSKTVEGLIGGGLSAVLFGTALWWITPFSPLAAAAISAAIVILGFLGGLTLSAVKRSLGAKDWGVMIEGHGGMLDRLDSVCFAAPVFFHIVRFFYI